MKLREMHQGIQSCVMKVLVSWFVLVFDPEIQVTVKVRLRKEGDTPASNLTY